MKYKCVCVMSASLCFMICCALEGNALSAGQAAMLLLPAVLVMLWSFMRTDWCELTRKEESVMDERSRLIEVINRYLEKLSYERLKNVFYFVEGLTEGEWK